MTALRSKFSTLFRNGSQFFSPRSSSTSRHTSRRSPRKERQAHPFLHANFTKHLSSHPMVIEERLYTIPCHNHSCCNTITIVQETTTKDLTTPVSLKLSQILPTTPQCNLTQTTVSTTMPLRNTAFMEEVNTYKSLLEDEKYNMIGGNYDDRGREILVEGDKKEVCCIACGQVWKFVVRCVKRGGGVRVVLDFE